MPKISDLPPFVIDQIVGNNDTSYVVIKLWLCGDSNLHNKLATGLTFLDLKLHRLGACLFPKVILQLQALRHFSLKTHSDLVKDSSHWSEIMQSLPSTLESLSLCGTAQDLHACVWSSRVPIRYARGKSFAIDFEALFPRLHTLKLVPFWVTLTSSLTNDLFAALPSSLTVLDVPIEFTAPFQPFSTLPPNIRHLQGIVTWAQNDIEQLRHCFASAPSSLESINFGYDLSWSKDTVAEFWLPKSLLEVEFPDGPSWTPSLARTMPPKLLTLALVDVDHKAFENTNTNWAADLPRTLTDLDLVFGADEDDFNFAPFSHFLPAGLTSLFMNLSTESSASFGNCSWPIGLTRLGLSEFHVHPRDIINLPKTLKELCFTAYAPFESELKEVLDTKLLPQSLTDLTLQWNEGVAPTLSFENMKLQRCTLMLYSSDEPAVFDRSSFKCFPSTLEELTLNSIIIGPAIPDDKLPELLPNLETVTVTGASCDWFEHIPRRVRHLSIYMVYDVLQSPLLADGQLFKHLPASLVELNLLDVSTDLARGFELPPQSFDHLPSLQDLSLEFTAYISSRMLRNLPRELRSFSTRMRMVEVDDAPFLPPRLKKFSLRGLLPELVEYLPLACLPNQFPRGPLSDRIEERFRQAIQNP